MPWGTKWHTWLDKSVNELDELVLRPPPSGGLGKVMADRRSATQPVGSDDLLVMSRLRGVKGAELTLAKNAKAGRLHRPDTAAACD